jgi:ABC-type Mn2+/Zn2+ transport system permease subunit
VIALGIVGGAIMLNKRKDVAYYLIALIVVSLLISTLANDPGVDIALSIVMFFGLALGIICLARKNR